MSRFIGGAQFRQAFDETESVLKVAMLSWDSGSLSWIKYTGSAGGGGGSVSVTNFPSVYEVRSYAMASIIDEASSTVTYVGKAAAGSSTASAVWQIQKISISGSVTTISWADGDGNFDNVWNNRASLSYS